MSSIGDLNIRIDAVINPLLRSLNKAERSLRATGERMSRIGGDLAMNVSLPLAAIGAASIKAAGNMEQMKNGLASMMGGAAAASAELVKLQEIAKLPGINLNQAIAGSLRLQAVGLSADQARKSMTSFSNALTLAGGNSEDLAGVTLALTQIVSKGKVFAEEINQIAERVPQVRKAMMNIWGTADTEALQKMGISTEDFITKVTDELERLPKATGGILNAIDNNIQAVTMILSNLGDDINQTFDITATITAFTDKLAYAAEWFKNLDAGTKKTVLSVAAFTIAVGPAIKVIGLFQTTLSQGIALVGGMGKGFLSLKNTIVSAGAAFLKMDLLMKATTIGAIIAGVTALYLVYNKLTAGMSQASAVMATVNQATLDGKIAAFQETNELERLKATLNSEVTSREAKKAALDRLLAINPELFKGYTIEKGSIEGINAAIGTQIRLIELRSKVNAAAALLQKKNEEKLLLENELAAANKKQLSSFAPLAGAQIAYANLAGTTADAIQRKIIRIDAETIALAKLQQQTEELLATQSGGSSSSVIRGGGGVAKSGGGSSKSSSEPITATQYTRDEVWGKDQEINVQWQRSLKLLDALKTKSGELKSTTDELNKSKQDTLLADKGITEQTPLSIEAMEKQMEAVEKLKTAYQGAATFQEAALNSMQQIGGILMDTMTQTGKSFKDMALEATGAILKVVKALLMQAVAQQIVNAMISSGGNPFVALAIGAIAGAGVGILFNTLASALGVPALAEGGLAYGPQLAMVGDNKNASSDPEVIAPLSKLQGMLGGTGGNVQIAGAFTGSEMRLLNEREARNRGRIRGF